MFLRCIRYRLRSDWLRLLLGLVFAVILFSWTGTINIISDELRSFSGYVSHYQDVANHDARKAGLHDPAPANNSDFREGYELLLRETKGYLFAVLVESVNDLSPPLTVIPLAALLITGLFQKKRLGQLLAAGVGRKQAFLSITGVYFGCVALVWAVSAVYLMKRYRIEFAPEEQVFYRVILLTWFCAFLWHASVSYLAAMLLRRPLPAFGAALALWFMFGSITVRTPNVLPSYIIDNSESVKPLLPGIDLQPLLRTDLVAAGFFLLTVLIAWLAFRKRDQI